MDSDQFGIRRFMMYYNCNCPVLVLKIYQLTEAEWRMYTSQN